MENKPFRPNTNPPAPEAGEANGVGETGLAKSLASGRMPHESLLVWKLAREVVAFVVERRPRLRGLPGELASHIERAAVSTALNVAEAAARPSPRDRKSRFAIARGEATEVAAALDLAELLGAVSPNDLAQARALLLPLCRMLGKLAA